MPKTIRYHWELEVYKLSVEAAMKVFELSKNYPKEETYSLTDQVRRSSRSVSGQIAESWRRRKYEAVFVNKMNEAEGEAAETRVWMEYAVRCGYLTQRQGRDVIKLYNQILGKLLRIGNNPKQWVLPRRSN